MRPLALLGLLVIAAPASAAKLLVPAAETFYVEPFAGGVFTLTSADDPVKDLGLGGETTWDARFQFGVVLGGRVWEGPLNLDAGLRLGMSFQSGYTVNNVDQGYETAIRILEVTPLARATVFPFKSEVWGVSAELGLGLLVSYGGAEGATPVPKSAQMSVRVRFGLGATWRLSPSQAVTLDVASLVTDFPATTDWKDNVGTMLAFEPRAGWQFRF